MWDRENSGYKIMTFIKMTPNDFKNGIGQVMFAKYIYNIVYFFGITNNSTVSCPLLKQLRLGFIKSKSHAMRRQRIFGHIVFLNTKYSVDKRKIQSDLFYF